MAANQSFLLNVSASRRRRAAKHRAVIAVEILAVENELKFLPLARLLNYRNFPPVEKRDGAVIARCRNANNKNLRRTGAIR